MIKKKRESCLIVIRNIDGPTPIDLAKLEISNYFLFWIKGT
jgi:hypothetical protein